MVSASTAVLLADAARRAAAYLDGLATRAVAPSPDAVAALRALEGPLPEAPSDPAAALAELDACVSPATMAMAGPRFFGFVIGGSLPGALAANVLAAAWDQNSAKWEATPGTAAVERVALRWTLEALGLPAAAPARGAPAAARPRHRLPPGRKREHRRVRPGRAGDRPRP